MPCCHVRSCVLAISSRVIDVSDWGELVDSRQLVDFPVAVLDGQDVVVYSLPINCCKRRAETISVILARSGPMVRAVVNL